MVSAGFTAKFEFVFVLTLENTLSWRFHFKANRKSIGSSKKMVLGIFKIALRLRDPHAFIWQSAKILNVFNTLTLKHIFWKTKTFQKLEYRFLVESAKIENASFSYKTALSEANVKTNSSIFSPGWTKLCNIIGEVKNQNTFHRRVILRTRISPGNTPGWIQPGY